MKLPFRSEKISTQDLPPVLRSNVPGTWAHDTMSRRIRNDIAARILNDNKDFLQLSPTCNSTLQQLLDELSAGRQGFLRDITDDGQDCEVWHGILATLHEHERNWLDAPWLISEFYFYRRIIEAFDFYQTKHDMFAKQKESGLLDATHHIQGIAETLQETIEKGEIEYLLEMGIFTSLWGNKLDLSLWPKTTTECHSVDVSNINMHKPGQISQTQHFKAITRYILEDHSNELIEYLLLKKANLPKHKRIIDIIVDNAGFELVSDFIFAHILLSTGVASKIRFRTKAHPTFVSDVTNDDCRKTISYLQNPALGEKLTKLGIMLQEYVETTAFEFIEDVFWCQPLAFWDMTDNIFEDISDSILVVSKGDANYRRLLGDREWPLDTPSKDVFSYWLVPICALRTLKAEVGCGINKEKQILAASEDKRWLVSGNWGVVQFFC